MTGATEPNGWELKRSIDQLRSDQKDDLGDLKQDLNGIGAKIDGLGTVYVTKTEHGALEARVTTIEEARKTEAADAARQRVEDNRARRANNIAIAALLITALGLLITTVLQLAGK